MDKRLLGPTFIIKNQSFSDELLIPYLNFSDQIKQMMQMNRDNDDFAEENAPIVNQEFSITQYAQTHPYKYLKQLNNVYQNCNKSSGKDYSSASMIKLPWKKFKTVSIPKCFQQSYNHERKETFIFKNFDQNDKSQQQQKERKFWREHEQLMKKYHKNNIASNNMKKKKMQQRRNNLFSAWPHQNSYMKKNSSLRTLKETQQSNQQLHCNNGRKQDGRKQNAQQIIQTLKTQSDKTQNAGSSGSKNALAFKQNNSADHKSTKNKIKPFSKTRIHKSRYSNGQITVEEQVLQKLKKISMMPHFNRAKTANLLSRKTKNQKDRQKAQFSDKKTIDVQSLGQSRVRQGQYLQFNKQEQLIKRYKNKIKQIDCSISQKNAKKTADILKQMHQLSNLDIQDY